MSSEFDIYVDRLRTFHSVGDYTLTHLLPRLRKAGVAYRLLEDIPKSGFAECAFVHVDLTDVPEPFASVHRHYRKTINGRATTIRRTLYSQARLKKDDAHDGPVISKTVLNSGGYPELRYLKNRNVATRVGHVLKKLTLPGYKQRHCPPYRIYESITDVPDETWHDPRLIVERFLPGTLDLPVERYRYNFALSVELNLLASYDDLFGHAAKVVSITEVPTVPDEVLALRERLHLDYGAIDYFIIDGTAFVIDANKTVQTDSRWVHEDFVQANLDEIANAVVGYIRT